MSVFKTCSAGSCHQPGFLPVTTDCHVLQVTPFFRWERELPKLVGASRYKAIDKPKERRQIFDDFCRNVAEEQRLSKQRKDQQAAAAEPAFLALLNEAQAIAHEAQLPQSPAGLFAACLLATCSLKEDGYCNICRVPRTQMSVSSAGAELGKVALDLNAACVLFLESSMCVQA